MIEHIPNWAFWSLAVIGYGFLSYTIGKGIAAAYFPLWYEAKKKEKRIEFVAAMAGVLAFLLAAASLAYTVRQVDAATDRITALEKALDAMKPKP